MDLGYLDIHGADAFESVDYIAQRFMPLSKGSACMLLKIKLLLDLLALQKSEDVPVTQALPREVLDAIRPHLPRSPIVTQNEALRNGDNAEKIRELVAQIDQLYTHI